MLRVNVLKHRCKLKECEDNKCLRYRATAYQECEHVSGLLLSQHALRVRLRLKRETAQLVSCPVNAGEVDDIVNDIDEFALSATDSVR